MTTSISFCRCCNVSLLKAESSRSSTSDYPQLGSPTCFQIMHFDVDDTLHSNMLFSWVSISTIGSKFNQWVKLVNHFTFSVFSIHFAMIQQSCRNVLCPASQCAASCVSFIVSVFKCRAKDSYLPNVFIISCSTCLNALGFALVRKPC